MDAQREVLSRREDIIGNRRWLHRHPEESLHEYKTAAFIEEQLDQMSIPHRRVGETGIFAWLKGGQPGPITVLRADIDALKVPDEKDVAYKSLNPGFSHSCGHDMHMAGLLGAMMLLAPQREQLKGEVLFFFQQAEEIGAGARQFIAAGLMEGATRVIGLHADSSVPSGKVVIMPGPNNASCDAFTLTVQGKSSHVSTPHLGADALYIASLIVVALQGLVTRLTSPVDPVIIGVGKMTAGTAYNALAQTATLEGTTRFMQQETRTQINQRLESLAQTIAEQYGGEAQVTFQAYASALNNDPAVCRELHALYRDIPGLEIVTDAAVKLGADDFAEFLLLVPGAYMYVGTQRDDDPNTGVPHHNGHFDVDEEAVLTGSTLFVKYVMSRHL
jgi:amidohydrolase